MILGVLLGGLVGFLLRPRAALYGQLPFDAVITRGLTWRVPPRENIERGAIVVDTGPLLDHLVLISEKSFDMMLIGAILGGTVGFIFGLRQWSRSK